MAKRNSTTHIVVHCSASKPSQDWGLYEIDRMHRARGFLKVGYHYIIRRDGTIELGRPVDDVGAHAKTGGYNNWSVGICLVGGVSETPQKHVPGNPWNGSDAEDNFTAEQRTALFGLIKDLWLKYGTIPVIGHRDIPKETKACPSFSIEAFMKVAFKDEFDKVYPQGFPSRWKP